MSRGGPSSARAVARRLASASLAVVAGVLLLLAPVAGGAAAQAQEAGVRLQGRELFRVGPDEKGDAGERARRIEGRLQRLARRDLPPAPAQVTAIAGGARAIVVDGATVLTVTPQDAEDNVATPDALAGAWASRIDAALQASASDRRPAVERLWSEVEGSIVTAFRRLLESMIVVVPRILAALLVLAGFWAAAAAVRAALRRLLPMVVRDPTLGSLVRQLTFFGILATGVAVAGDAMGFSPGSIVAGLGLTGLVLGFALKDILSNFVSGVLILALRPFEIGDQIVIGEATEGTVERIELRATQVRTYDGRVVLVPNAEVFTSRVTNNTADPVRRGNAVFRLGYDADLRRVAEALPGAVADVEGVLAGPAPRLRIAELGGSDVTLDLSFWTDSRRTDFQDASSAVRLRLLEVLRAEGVALPNPDVRILKPASAAAWREVCAPGSGAEDPGRRGAGPAQPRDAAMAGKDQSPGGGDRLARQRGAGVRPEGGAKGR